MNKIIVLSCFLFSIFLHCSKDLPIPPAPLIGNRVIMHPTNLVNYWRFSVLAKYITAHYWEKGYQTEWANKLYAQHLIKWARGTFHDYGKNCIEDYFTTFKTLIASLKSEGFNSQKTTIYVGKQFFVDGEHRIGACLALNKDVTVQYIDHSLPPNSLGYSSYHFKQCGLEQKYLDHMALEYAKLKNNTYLVILFPVIGSDNSAAYELLRQYGTVIYEKKVILKNNGPAHLIRHLYENENWNYLWTFDFTGAEMEAGSRFPEGQNKSVEVILWECPSLEQNKLCKEKIRKVYNNRLVIHINDTHEQTIYHAQVLFNNNSVNFLNYSRPIHLDRFVTLAKWYQEWLIKNHFDPESFCIDSSAVLSAYGIRDCNDLDFLHFGYDFLQHAGTENSLVSSHNHPGDLQYHVTHKDDILFNPENYFYYKGLKFASLDTVLSMKKKRNENKDQRDIALINNFLLTFPE